MRRLELIARRRVDEHLPASGDDLRLRHAGLALQLQRHLLGSTRHQDSLAARRLPGAPTAERAQERAGRRHAEHRGPLQRRQVAGADDVVEGAGQISGPRRAVLAEVASVERREVLAPTLTEAATDVDHRMRPQAAQPVDDTTAVPPASSTRFFAMIRPIDASPSALNARSAIQPSIVTWK